jgi:hypothetical protein
MKEKQKRENIVRILQVLGKPIAYIPAFSKVMQSTTAGIFTSQFLYWEGKQRDKEGWIYKSQNEIEEETGLSKGEQVRARKHIIKIGVLEEKKISIPPKIHYRFNWDKLNDLLESFILENSNDYANLPDIGKLKSRTSVNRDNQGRFQQKSSMIPSNYLTSGNYSTEIDDIQPRQINLPKSGQLISRGSVGIYRTENTSENTTESYTHAREDELLESFRQPLEDTFSLFEELTGQKMEGFSKDQYEPILLGLFIQQQAKPEEVQKAIRSAFQNWEPHYRSLKTILKKENILLLLDQFKEEPLDPTDEKNADQVLEFLLDTNTENEWNDCLQRLREKNDPEMVEHAFKAFERKYFALNDYQALCEFRRKHA